VPRQHLSISLNVKLGGVCLKISERNWLGGAERQTAKEPVKNVGSDFIKAKSGLFKFLLIKFI